MKAVRGTGRKTLIVLAVSLCALLVFSAGCSKKKAEPVPTQPETKTEVAPPPAANAISALDVTPASIEQGQSAQITASGTEGRSVKAMLTGPDGVTRNVALTGTGGSYTGTLSGTDSLAPGTYRLSAEMTGGGVDAATFTSGKTLTVTEKKPTYADCRALATELAGGAKIFFDFDKSDVRPETRTVISGLAARMANLEGAERLTIEGHCDERGTIEYNLALGGRRAKAIRAAFEAAGVKVTMADVSRGEENPVVRNASSEDDHQRNRRAELILQCR